MEQREQSQACLSYAESRESKAKPSDGAARAEANYSDYPESRESKAKPTMGKVRTRVAV